MMISSVPLLHHCCQCFSESRSFHHPLSRFRPTARPSYHAFLHFQYSASSIGLIHLRNVSSTHNINSTPFFFARKLFCRAPVRVHALNHALNLVTTRLTWRLSLRQPKMRSDLAPRSSEFRIADFKRCVLMSLLLLLFEYPLTFCRRLQ